MTGSRVQEGHFCLGDLRTTASHTIGIPHLVELRCHVSADASHEQYREAVIECNV